MQRFQPVLRSVSTFQRASSSSVSRPSFARPAARNTSFLSSSPFRISTPVRTFIPSAVTSKSGNFPLPKPSGQNATLTLPDGKSFSLPLLNGTEGPSVLDIRKLYDESGYFTYDPGFTSTAACYSHITFIDGPKGILAHRGYDIAELAEKSDFDEVTYLVMHGELPTREQKAIHSQNLKDRLVHEKLVKFYDGFKSDAHPMSIMVGVVGALSGFYHNALDMNSAIDRSAAAYHIVAKIPTMAAYAYKTSIGEPFMYPRDELGYAENFLYMMFGKPTENYKPRPAFVKAMETFLILHADHEQNASTSTVRIAGSSQADPFACIASGIAALWGPAHGGANEAVINMLKEIGDVKNIPDFLHKVKNKDANTRLMGFGHRVYKNFDPRAKQLKKVCNELLADLGQLNDPLFAIAKELEKIALNDEYFVKRKLYPNVDFYSGIMLRAMGIPTSMYTVLFAVGRAVGWISQWKEMIECPQQKIGRPRQLYVGHAARPFIPIDQRK